MRILFLTHYFHPEGNAPARRVYELTRRWAAEGVGVRVVTGVPNVPAGRPYPGYRNRLLQRETVEGVEVVRVWTFLAANRGRLRRTLNYLSFLATGSLAALGGPRPDLVIATSPQFFCGWAGVLASRLRGRPLVLEIRDLWPESIEAVGAVESSWPLRLLVWLERRMYAAARRVVAVGPGYRERLVARGVPREVISLVPNGVDVRAFAAARTGKVREELGLGGRFVCAYVGTLGMACGLGVVLRAAERLEQRGRDDVRFLLVGDGAVREALERRARDAGLRSVVFTGRVEKARVPELLAAADACLVHLARRELFRTVLPSKIFEAAALRKPIVLGVEGFAAELVGGAAAGICVEPENEAELLVAVDTLAGDPALARRMGEAGYEKIAKQYDYDSIATQYRSLLEDLCAEEAA